MQTHFISSIWFFSSARQTEIYQVIQTDFLHSQWFQVEYLQWWGQEIIKIYLTDLWGSHLYWKGNSLISVQIMQSGEQRSWVVLIAGFISCMFEIKKEILLIKIWVKDKNDFIFKGQHLDWSNFLFYELLHTFPIISII